MAITEIKYWEVRETYGNSPVVIRNFSTEAGAEAYVSCLLVPTAWPGPQAATVIARILQIADNACDVEELKKELKKREAAERGLSKLTIEEREALGLGSLGQPPCSVCGGEGATHGPDPYAEDVNNDDTPVWMCGGCRSDRADDV